MDDYGNQNKPVWFTEVGWHRNYGTFDGSIKPAVSERLQAAYVCRMYLTALRLGVERVHIMFLFDADSFNGGFFNSSNRSWYESAYTVQTMIDILPKPKIISAISDGTNGYYAYIINPDTDNPLSTEVIVAWNVEGPLEVQIPISVNGNYSVINMIGEEKTKEYESFIKVEIGPCPTYIIRQ